MTRDQAFSCTSSAEYIVKAHKNFDYATYYHNFCSGLNRNQVLAKLKNDLETMNADVFSWVNFQLDNNIPIEKSTSVDEFWLYLNEKQLYITRKSAEISRLVNYEQCSLSQTNNISSSSNKNIIQNHENVIESDRFIKFNMKSISSILKSNGKRMYSQYNQLSNTNKIKCCLCLNGILDLTNQSPEGQRSLFSESQWKYLCDAFKSTSNKHLYKISRETTEIIEKIKKKIKEGLSEDAYYCTLTNLKKTRSSEQCILKILAHVINCYRERSYIFTAAPEEVTELDFIVKLWGEIFELLFGINAQYIKWGESVSKSTTQVKKSNITSNEKKNVIGCKVDGRVLFNVKDSSNPVDLCQIEAAKNTNEVKKVYGDKAKLAIETKCAIDHMILNGSCNVNRKPQPVQDLQICGTLAEVCSLSLIDAGLYVHVFNHSLSLKPTLLEFSDIMVTWIRTLMTFKRHCNSTLDLSKAFFTESSKDINEVLCREEKSASNINYRFWVRGTCFLPTIASLADNNIPKFPNHFLSSPTTSTENQTEDEDYDIKELNLDDGTIVSIMETKDSNNKKVDNSTSDNTKKNKKILKTKNKGKNKEGTAQKKRRKVQKEKTKTISNKE